MDIYSADWVLPVEDAPIRDGAVAVEGSRIAAVGTAAELGEGRRFEGCALLPGFVNAHTHLEYAVYAGFGDGLPFPPWLRLHIERKARLEPGDTEDIARLGAAECIATGITTVGDSSYSGAAAVACAELGLRAVVYLEVFGSEPETALAPFRELSERLAPVWSERVRRGVGPHAPYTVSPSVYRACAELELPMTTHLSESVAELEWLDNGSGLMAEFREPYRRILAAPLGTTGPRMLAAEELLGPGLVAAHCVHVDDEEIHLLADTRTGVVHCPRSNAFLGCGIAPLAALREAGARVGLGTDSPASAPSFDVFDELRAAVAAARARERRADALSPSEALELATLGSARALGLEAEVGSLAPGKRADLTVVSLEGSAYHPWEDPAAAVVFGGAPDRVVATLVDGGARYEKGGFEWHELRRSAASARRRMLSEHARAAAAAGS